MYTDEEMETEMGTLLRAGVVIACVIMILGGIGYLLRHGGERESYAAFHAVAPPFESVGGVFGEALKGSARGIMQLGVLIMIATPVLRVAFAVYGFTRQRQWWFSLVSATVLGLLAFGLFNS